MELIWILYDIFPAFRFFEILPQLGIKLYKVLRLCDEVETAGLGRMGSGMEMEEELHFASCALDF